MSATVDAPWVVAMRAKVDGHAAAIDRNVAPLVPFVPFVTEQEKQDATDLALAWVNAADERRITEADLAMVASIASTALDAVRCRSRREARS